MSQFLPRKIYIFVRINFKITGNKKVHGDKCQCWLDAQHKGIKYHIWTFWLFLGGWGGLTAQLKAVRGTKCYGIGLQCWTVIKRRGCILHCDILPRFSVSMFDFRMDVQSVQFQSTCNRDAIFFEQGQNVTRNIRWKTLFRVQEAGERGMYHTLLQGPMGNSGTHAGWRSTKIFLCRKRFPACVSNNYFIHTGFFRRNRIFPAVKTSPISGVSDII